MCESHPFDPFMPKNAKVLILGSFPPLANNRSMEFYYPNFQRNDMWRIMGIVFYGDEEYFVVPNQEKFNKEKIKDFCSEKGIAIADSAKQIIRLKNNSLDKDMKVIETMDFYGELKKIPNCMAVIFTGQKAADIFCEKVGIEPPELVRDRQCIRSVDYSYNGHMFKLYRSYSPSSRACRIKREGKADIYKGIFQEIGLLINKES